MLNNAKSFLNTNKPDCKSKYCLSTHKHNFKTQILFKHDQAENFHFSNKSLTINSLYSHFDI